MNRTAAILLSRQALRPSRRDPWVSCAIEAVDWLQSSGRTLWSSVGMQTWELVTAMASRRGIPLKILVPATDEDQFKQLAHDITTQFDLRADRAELVPLYPQERGTDKQGLMQLRDQQIVHEADLLIPVSLRPGGNLDRLVHQFSSKGKSITHQFQTDYCQGRNTPLAYRVGVDSLSQDIREIGDHYLIHWTRGPNSAWPTEHLIDYYGAVASSDSHPRSAFATLQNMLAAGTIVASSRHMPGKERTVAWSNLSPVDVLPLIRWRARFRQMSFEPYGIGIEKDYAAAVGIRPVKYYDRSEHNVSRPEDRWLTQSTGTRSDWRQENEYRHKGDFDLSQVPAGKIVCFTYGREEAKVIRRTTGLATLWFLT